MPTPAPDWKYDATQGRYRRNGRFLSGADVMAAVDSYLYSKQGNAADNLFQLLREGQLSVKELQLIGAREISKAHMVGAMAAKGGKAQMSQADNGRVGGIVRSELAYWRDLMKELAKGRPIDGSVKASFRGYFAAAANTYWRIEDGELEKRGFDLEANVLDDGARHCESGTRPSCPQVTAKGWYKRGTMPRRGARGCRWNCHCGRKAKNSITGEVRE